MGKRIGRIVGSPTQCDEVYGPTQREAICALVDLEQPPVTGAQVTEDPALLANVDLVLGTWGMPKLTEALLDAAPKLDAVFYGAGSIRGFMTDAAWDRGITITAAYEGNAIPVSEMTLSQILFALKFGWQHALTIKREQHWNRFANVPGAYGSTVGLVSLGAIGRRVVEHLSRFDVKVIAYDVREDEAMRSRFGVRYVGLEELFATADVVSLHTPWLPQTVGMIHGGLLRQMKPNATFINTARGAVVNEADLAAVLAERPDLVALLDVTYPEPPKPESPLWSLPNVILLPHIAGAVDLERRRLGTMMVDELRCYLAGEPLQWQIDRERAAMMA